MRANPRPNSLVDAFRLCVAVAGRHRMNIDRISDVMGLGSSSILYKWLSNGSMPARLIRTFETACQCHAVSEYIAASTGTHVMVKVPTGRLPRMTDIGAVQSECGKAVSALIEYATGKRSAADTEQILTGAITALAAEREQVRQSPQLAMQFHKQEE